MMAVIRWTLWQRRWSIIWWCVGITAFLVLSLGFYPAVRDQAAELDQALEHIPKAAKAFITDQSDILSPTGFLSARVFYLMLPLILGVLTIGLGNSLLAKEESEGTLELLLSRPISRGRLLAAKALSGLIILAVVGAVALIDILVLSKLVGMEVPLSDIALATLLCLLFVLSLGSIAFYMSSVGRRGRLAGVGVAVFIGLGSYIVSSLTSLADWLKWPDRFLPYHYYRPGEVLNGVYDWGWAWLFVVIIVILGVLSWASFRRRDIGA
ncbi:MAG TPA: ABC transporter permease subunit [Candidatus Saccharimonadales bacterium]|nr:ABC transporter permease subunit [Candidatus Saccharimonadales bacterium]